MSGLYYNPNFIGATGIHLLDEEIINTSNFIMNNDV